MAGAGFKTFSAGEVLLASEVNTYLMQQAVMVFGSSAVRATAIPSPSEGMLAYLTDTNNVEKYTGASWEPIAAGDISAVTAGTGLTGGGASGDVTLNLDRSLLVTQVAAGTGITGGGTAGVVTLNLDRSLLVTAVGAGTALTGGGTAGSVTLNVTLDEYPQAYPQTASGSVAAGSTITLNVGTAQYHVVQLPTSGTATIAFTGIATSGKIHAWQVELAAGTPAPGTVVFPAAVSFSGGTYPTITANKKTVLSFLTRNAGTAIYGGSSFSAV